MNWTLLQLPKPQALTNYVEMSTISTRKCLITNYMPLCAYRKWFSQNMYRDCEGQTLRSQQLTKGIALLALSVPTSQLPPQLTIHTHHPHPAPERMQPMGLNQNRPLTVPRQIEPTLP